MKNGGNKMSQRIQLKLTLNVVNNNRESFTHGVSWNLQAPSHYGPRAQPHVPWPL